MYRRNTRLDWRKRKKRKKMLLAFCVLATIISVGSISMGLSKMVLAAPEEPALVRQSFDTLSANSVSNNSVSCNSVSANSLSANSVSENSAVQEVQKEANLPIVAIDAGHGGMDEGSKYEDVYEKDINLKISQALERKLLSMNYEVLMLRGEDSYIAKEERVEKANQYGADIYISIHQNIYEDAAIGGIETYYYGEEANDSKRLAQLVHKESVRNSGAIDREVRNDEAFHVISNAAMPSCLIETGFLSNASERSLLLTEEYIEKLADGIAQGIELYFHPKTMYWTFDDGPSAENTNKILDILKRKNIKATFFLVGENVRKHPEVAQRIAAEGHTIGIHCNIHDYDALYQSAESYIQDFEEAYHVIREVTGVETKMFRFPGGSVNRHNEKTAQKIAEEMTNRGYVYYDWNASIEDAVKDAKPEQLISNAVESLLGRKKIIMLAHDVKDTTAECFEELLEQFPEYKMEMLTEEVEAIQF